MDALVFWVTNHYREDLKLRPSKHVYTRLLPQPVVVRIDRRMPHPQYGKMVTRTRKLKAHDEENSAKLGDLVRIMETRPLSKDKRWRVVEIVERAR